jgi:hypothetical protein
MRANQAGGHTSVLQAFFFNLRPGSTGPIRSRLRQFATVRTLGHIVSIKEGLKIP